ncbi:MAG: glycosyltransferase [Patescibacteria group bacterium]
MKIAIITNLYPPFVRGGAEWLTYLMAVELKKIGHDVLVITSSPKTSLANKKIQLLDEGGIAVYRFCPTNIYYYLNANKYPKIIRLMWQVINLFNWNTRQIIKKILIKERPQLVITANLMGLTFLLPKLLYQLAFTHFHIVHDVQLLHPSGLFIAGNEYINNATKLYQLITRLLFGSPKVVIFPSRWLCQEYTSKNFFPLSNKIVQRNPSLGKNIHSIKPTSSTFKILYVGQAEEHKGIFWLSEILKSYSRPGWLMEIVIIGQTGDLERIHKLVDDDIRFRLYDRLTQAEVESKYQQATIVIVPSLCMENSPVSIQQALSVSTPVLAAKVGGVPELVQEEKTGWLFEAGDKQELIKKLDYLLSNPKIVSAIASKINTHYQPVTLAEYVDKLIFLLN